MRARAVAWLAGELEVRGAVRAVEARRPIRDSRNMSSDMSADTEQMTQLLLVNPVSKMVREEVVDRLREAIMVGRLTPGQRLTERELCQWTGVSRTSVREALRQLEAEGLVVHIPRKGPAVARMSLDDVSAIYDVRMVLEPRVVELFIEHADDREVGELRRATDAVESAAERGERETFSKAKTRYFEILMGGSHNHVLEDFVRSLHLRLGLVRSSYLAHAKRWPESAKELRAITDAIARRDTRSAVKACKLHLERATAAALDMLMEDAETEVQSRAV